MEKAPTLFSTRITNGRRTIYFDIKATVAGKPYIKIQESVIELRGKKVSKFLIILEDEIPEFKSAVDEIMGFIGVMK